MYREALHESGSTAISPRFKSDLGQTKEWPLYWDHYWNAARPLTARPSREPNVRYSLSSPESRLSQIHPTWPQRIPDSVSASEKLIKVPGWPGWPQHRRWHIQHQLGHSTAFTPPGKTRPCGRAAS
jgi:hypothetical protein